MTGPIGERTGTDTPNGCILGVFSLEGGVGKSLLAANLAAGLGFHQPDQVGLVDCDLRGGAGLADELGVRPAVTILDWLFHPPGAEARATEYFARHRCGFRLLAGTNEPHRLAGLPAVHLASRILELSMCHQYLILDLPTGFDTYTVTLLHLCRRVYVPVRSQFINRTAAHYFRRHLEWAGLSGVCQWIEWGHPRPGLVGGENGRPPPLHFPWSPMVVAQASALGRLPIEWPFTKLGQVLQHWADQVWLETRCPVSDREPGDARPGLAAWG